MTTYNDLAYVVLDNKLKIHQRHLQFLAIEVYNSRNKLNPCFMKKAYVKKNIPYCLRIGLTLLISCAITRIYGINFLKFRKRFVEQLTRKFKRMPVSSRI